VSEGRPDPEALLQRARREEKSASRGRLKVFFGAAPGVGKTYAMLEAARLQRASGADVVVGWLETHGRAETAALAEGIEVVPPRAAELRGVTLRELDLDAALARRPAILLLDELAHTNAPGGRHAKRWQDAEELRAAGIDVWTTLNVQHLESVNDLVQRITGVVVRETVPDHLLDEADAVEFVDLPPEDLMRRLGEGKVYVPDQAARAVRQFFREGNLTALRELALRRTAEHVDAAVRGYRLDHSIEKTWPVAERVLVCIRPNPESPRLVRGARRLATRLRAEWIALWVESPGQPALSADERRHLAGAFSLAEQLGAQTATITGPSVAEAVLRFARERNVSKLVVGKPAHPRWRDRLRGSLVDDLVRASGELDVFVIAGEAGEPVVAARAKRSPPRGYLFAVAVVIGATLVSIPLAAVLDKLNLVMIYLLGVVLVATRYGRGPSTLAAVVGVAVCDFFFVPPHLTFEVADTQYVVTFAVMLVVGLLVSTLAARARDIAEMSLQRERRTQSLYALSRELNGLRDPGDVAAAGARHVADALRCSAVVFLPGEEGGLEPADGVVPPFAAPPGERAVAQWALEHAHAAGAGTDTLPAAAALYEPLDGSGGPLGVLAVEVPPAQRPLGPEQRELVSALARQIAAPLERARLAREAERSRVAAESEKLRSSLLSSVSHDLRTPLAAITGAASALRDDEALGPALVHELASTVFDEAERLNRLVRNLLDMTRLESGTLAPRRDWHSLEEIVGSALARVERHAGEIRFEARVDPSLPLVAVDAVLVEQALVNILENAVRHGGREGRVRVAARAAGRQAVVEVCDEGPGFPPEDAERLFEKFHRSAGGPGAGLGLAISRAIVVAHGGTISARLLEPHGACFTFTLPLSEPPAPPPPEEGAA
jgi:two-component system sensor histidine kinase KdpD